MLCLVVGFLFGRPALRLEGLYLALATFSLALAVPQILKYFEHWTGGSQGIVLSKPKAPWGLQLDRGPVAVPGDAHHHRDHVRPRAPTSCAAGSAALMVAIRDNHIAAEAMGVDSALVKSVTFGVSAAYTGVAGALSAVAIAYVAPDSFNVFLSITFLIGIVIGGLALDLGQRVRSALHPVRPQLGPGHLQGRPLGHLRHLPDRVHVRHALRHRRGAAAPLDPRRPGRAFQGKEVKRSRRRIPHQADTMTKEDNMIGRKLLVFALAGALIGVGLASAVSAQTVVGVTPTEIKIGNTNPYSGPASAYGTIGKAIGAYFKKVNDEGGVNGRKINYITLRRRL